MAQKKYEKRETEQLCVWVGESKGKALLKDTT